MGLHLPPHLSALLSKSAAIQKRQILTNIALLIIPLTLLILLYILQIFVDDIIVEQLGEFTPAVVKPSTLAPFRLIPYPDSENETCPKGGIGVAQGKVYVVGGGDGVGGWAGVTPGVLDLLQEVVEGGTFSDDTIDTDDEVGSMEVTNGSESSLGLGALFGGGGGSGEPPDSLLAGATVNPIELTGFYAERFLRRGGTQSICLTYPLIVLPDLHELPSPGAADAAVLDDWFAGGGEAGEQWIGGYHFTQDVTPQSMDVTIGVNDTLTARLDVPAMAHFVVAALFNWATNGTAQLEFVGTTGYPAPRRANVFDLQSLIGPTLYIYLFQLLFPTLVATIVREKELGLREQMKMMGLQGRTYWAATYLFGIALYTVSLFLVFALAAALQIRFFTENSFAALFIFLWVWGNAMVAFALAASTLFAKAKSATVVGYVYVFATGLLSAQLIRNYFSEPSTPEGLLTALCVVPQFALYRGLFEFGQATSFDGLGLTTSEAFDPELTGIQTATIALVVEWFLALLFTGWADQVLRIGPGIKKHPLFFVKEIRTALSGGGAAVEETPTAASDTTDNASRDPAVVAAERKAMSTEPDAAAIVARHVRKVYPGHPPKVALKGVSMVLEHDSVLGLVGGNGAGKSTFINALSGYSEATSGFIAINGHNLATDAEAVYHVLGVCPQHDRLYEDLTCAEHLQFFARIRGVAEGEPLREAVDYWLGEVNLTAAGNRRAKALSGGMKRRLSVASAFIGDTKVVCLDESSAGLDPASKADLWRVIRRHRKGRTILLTSHDLAEVEELSDVIAVFTLGELVAIGSAQQLKARYGEGVKITLQLSNSSVKEDTALEPFRALGNMVVLHNLAGTIKLQLPKRAAPLSKLFQLCSRLEEESIVSDWNVTGSSMEEVFLEFLTKQSTSVNER